MSSHLCYLALKPYRSSGAVWQVIGRLSKDARTPLGEGWLALLFGNPLMLPIARFVYDGFADMRFARNKRKGHW
jgi:predicted DCC family thiol-disulfide oxidoreductase YuxK